MPTRRTHAAPKKPPGQLWPNPWAAVSPPCPNGHPPLDVYLWHPAPQDRLGRWICLPCGRRFNPVPPPPT